LRGLGSPRQLTVDIFEKKRRATIAALFSPRFYGQKIGLASLAGNKKTFWDRVNIVWPYAVLLPAGRKQRRH